MNSYQGQICAKDRPNGIFLANEQIFNLIQETAIGEVSYVKRIGVSAPIHTKIKINDVIVEIGETGLYESDEVEITSIKFVENSSSFTIIDFIIELT